MIISLSKCMFRQDHLLKTFKSGAKAFSSIVNKNSKAPLKTIVCPSMSKLIDNLEAERNSIPTQPGSYSAVVGGKEYEYHYWKTRLFRYGPKKMELLAKLMRKKTIGEAIKQLSFSKKKYGLDLAKALGVIENNIKDHLKLDPKDFFIRNAIVCKGKYIIKHNVHRPNRLVKVRCRTSSVAIRVGMLNKPNSSLEKSALDIHKIIKEQPFRLLWRKPVFMVTRRSPRYMPLPPKSSCRAEPLHYYEGNIWDDKSYFKQKPTDQSVYRLPRVFEATPQSLVDTASVKKRQLRMRASNSMQILRKKCITRYR